VRRGLREKLLPIMGCNQGFKEGGIVQPHWFGKIIFFNCPLQVPRLLRSSFFVNLKMSENEGI